MANPVKPIPDGYHAITPYLTIKDASKAIDFYKEVFHATERMRMPDPSGRIMHAELQIGDSVIMLGDESPQMGNKSPQSIGGTPVGFCIYVKDVDVVVKTATDCGRNGAETDSRPILRRQKRYRARPLRPYMDDCDAHRRRSPRRDAQAHGKSMCRRVNARRQRLANAWIPPALTY